MRCTGMMALLAVFGLLLVGCASGPTAGERSQLSKFKKSYQLTVSTDRFALAPPDVITIYAAKAPEVDKAKQTIAPDGTINLELLNRVYVAGMSPQEVENLLAEKLKTFYQDVKVRVDVEYKSQWYYVFGETTSSGRKPDTPSIVISGAWRCSRVWSTPTPISSSRTSGDRFRPHRPSSSGFAA